MYVILYMQYMQYMYVFILSVHEQLTTCMCGCVCHVLRTDLSDKGNVDIFSNLF